MTAGHCQSLPLNASDVKKLNCVCNCVGMNDNVTEIETRETEEITIEGTTEGEIEEEMTGIMGMTEIIVMICAVTGESSGSLKS